MSKLLARSALLLSFFVVFLNGCSSVPEQTHDGLTLVPTSKFDQVYRKQEAELSSYQAFGLESCEVAFKKNWQRKQNQSRLDLSSRVTQKDIDRIKGDLSLACDEKFRAALLESPAYSLVDKFSDGEAVLILRPAIINLDINSPDVRTVGTGRSYTTSAGEMTLSLEAVDATTGEVLVRVVDRKRGADAGIMEWSSSISNKAEADRTLSRWAKVLREGLDEARRSP